MTILERRDRYCHYHSLFCFGVWHFSSLFKDQSVLSQCLQNKYDPLIIEIRQVMISAVDSTNTRRSSPQMYLGYVSLSFMGGWRCGFKPSSGLAHITYSRTLDLSLRVAHIFAVEVNVVWTHVTPNNSTKTCSILWCLKTTKNTWEQKQVKIPSKLSVGTLSTLSNCSFLSFSFAFSAQ